MKKIIVSVLILMNLSFCITAQNTSIDLTKTDITILKNFDGTNASFMDLKVGLSKADAIKKLKELTQFYWQFEEFNTKSEKPDSKEEMRIYVYTKNASGEKDKSILYLIWDKGTLNMTSIVFFGDIATYLKGNTTKLFTKEALEKNALCRSFLNTSFTEVTDDIGITEINYPKQHTTLLNMVYDGETTVWFKFFK